MFAGTVGRVAELLTPPTMAGHQVARCDRVVLVAEEVHQGRDVWVALSGELRIPGGLREAHGLAAARGLTETLVEWFTRAGGTHQHPGNLAWVCERLPLKNAFALAVANCRGVFVYSNGLPVYSATSPGGVYFASEGLEGQPVPNQRLTAWPAITGLPLLPEGSNDGR